MRGSNRRGSWSLLGRRGGGYGAGGGLPRPDVTAQAPAAGAIPDISEGSGTAPTDRTPPTASRSRGARRTFLS